MNLQKNLQVNNSRGKPIIYGKLGCALYGIMQAALLFYEKIVGDLLEYGFTLNPYDPCVANKMVHVSLLTILWHVEDLKISHSSKDVVTDVIDRIRERYETLPGDYGTMKVVRGKQHDFLGVNFDF